MDKREVKQKYEKPTLRSIELRADEVLAVGCKTASVGVGPSGSPCMLESCSIVGS